MASAADYVVPRQIILCDIFFHPKIKRRLSDLCPPGEKANLGDYTLVRGAILLHEVIHIIDADNACQYDHLLKSGCTAGRAAERTDRNPQILT